MMTRAMMVPCKKRWLMQACSGTTDGDCKRKTSRSAPDFLLLWSSHRSHPAHPKFSSCSPASPEPPQRRSHVTSSLGTDKKEGEITEMGADRVSPSAARVRKHTRTMQTTVLREATFPCKRCSFGSAPLPCWLLCGASFCGARSPHG